MPIAFALTPTIASLIDPTGAAGFSLAYKNGKVQTVLLSGRNPAAPTASLGDIWGYPNIAVGQQVRVLPAAGYTIAIVSDSANDTGAGTGAQQVAVSYLDSNYNQHFAIYVMNGTTAVTVAASIDGGAGGAVTNALRQNGMEVLAAGTGLANAGNIFVTDSTNTYAAGVPVTTSLVYDCILVGDNNDCTSGYTIPAGYTGMVVALIPAVNDVTATTKTGKVVVGLTTGSNGIFLRFDLGDVSSASNAMPLSFPQIGVLPMIQPKSDIRIQAQVSATTEIGCANFLVMWPNNLQTA